MILPYGYTIIVLFVSLAIMLLGSQRCFAQMPQAPNDSLAKLKFKPVAGIDTGKKLVDTAYKNLKSVTSSPGRTIKKWLASQDSALSKVKIKKPSVNSDSLKKKQLSPYSSLLKFSSPFFHIGGGYVAYNYNYRSSTDTPYAEKNISQNTINASLNFSIEKYIPFIANAYIARSNSIFFRNITDIQVVFNSAAFHNQFAGSMKQMMASMTDSLKNSDLENAYKLKRKQLMDLENWLHNPFQLQRLVQANEILNVPQKSHDPSLPDSVNAKRTDSLQALARNFIKTYKEQKGALDGLKHEQDSLESRYKMIKSLIERYKSLVNGGGSQNNGAMNGITDSLKKYGIQNTGVPPQYSWLLGVRNFAIGKAPVNYTELTAKNISITGVNWEYSSRYYLAFCAGLIDYRFNDPVVNSSNKVSQYMYMARIGMGKVEDDHLILSFYGGKKQLFTAADSAGPLASIPVTGISAETKIKINSNSFLIAEVAESFSPDYHFSPVKQSSGFNFSDNTNKALSLKAYAYIPETGTHLEASYKYTGSNFQSFSFFQTNSTLKTWSVKADQYFWDRKLRITASVKTNDFVNPYIVQNYNSNTIFTSISASFRIRKFPSITIGYMPMSQLTAVGSEIVENKFETLTANLNHYYRIGSIRASSTVVLSKFYNGGSDTSFVFYNATNILVQQSFFFKDFTGSLNFSRSASARYDLNVVGEEVDFPFSKRGSMGVGIKLNSYNQTENKIGEVFNMNYQIGRMDYISITAERGYLPGTSGMLVHNDFGNVQFVVRFK
jgi:hypothetical protein